MKILIITREVKGLKHPHAFSKEHLRKVRDVAGTRAEIIVTSNAFQAEKHVLDADVIAGFPWNLATLSFNETKKLKWVHSFSAGMDRALTPQLVRSPALATNSSGIHKIPIAEHVIGFMLMFTRGFHRTFWNQAKEIWQKDETLTELRGKTVLVVGLGNIGGEVARLARAFKMRVLVADRHNILSLAELLPHSDFVVIALPLTKETHHFFDMKKLKAMKRSAILINIARGGIVKEKDLVQALKRKLIAGAALDVTEQEPLPKGSPLWKMKNVIVTPHHSGLSEHYMERAIDVFCENMRAFLKGRSLPNLVDKKRGY